MAIKNYITQTGVNYERNLDTGKEKTASSHVVGYDGISLRMERYVFQTPSNLSKISLTKITFPNGVYTPGHEEGFHVNWVTDIKARFLISTSSTDWPATDKIGTAGYAITSVTNSGAYADVQNLNLESGKTYYLYVFGGAGHPNTFGWRYWNSGNAPTLTVNEEAYTNIGKPSNIKASASYVIPGGSLTVTWTKAANGTNNPVKSYTVNWDINGSTQTPQTVETNSVVLTIPSNVERGTSIKCTIQANPSQSGYGSEAVTQSNIAKINRLPSAPTVTPSTTIVPSTGGSVKFTLSGSDPDGQNISFKCGSELFKSGSIKEIKENTTLKFRINDGLEDGPITEITIYKNTQPTFNTSIEGTAIAPIIKITPINGGSSNTYTCSLVYGTTVKSIDSNNKTGIFSITDIRSYGISPNIAYSFTITRNDGIETCSKSKVSADWLVAPACPTYVQGNNSSDKYVSKLEGYFDSTLSPVFSGVNDLNKVQITINNINYPLDLIKKNNSDQWYFSLSDEVLSTFVRGEPTSMKMVFGKDNLLFSAYSIEKKFTRVISGADALSNLVLNGFNLFKSTPVLTFRNMYSDYNTYGFANDPLSEGTTHTFQVSFNGTTPLEVNFCPDSVTSDNQISYQLSGQEIYNRLVDVLEHGKTNTIPVTVSFKNDLGGTASKTINTDVDCDIKIKLGTLTLSAQGKEISTWNYLLQGMTIKNDGFSCTAYSKDLSAQIYVSRDNGSTWIAYKQISGKTTDDLIYGKPSTFNFEITELATIGPTSIDYSPQFKIKLFTSKGIEKPKAITLNKPVTVKALIAPTINIVSGTYEKNSDGNGTITIKYQFDDNNDNTITRNSLVELYIGAEEVAKGSWSVDANQTVTQSYTIGDKIESVLVYLKGIITAGAATTTDTKPSYTVSTTTETPVYTIFNIQPTVSYRKNRLGINSSIDGEGNENYVIKIASSGSSSATQIALVSKKGAVRVIDIEEGTLANFNFIIDCGTWNT